MGDTQHLSKPFASRWYTVVLILLQPSRSGNFWKKRDSNWRPLSVVMREGTPNLAIRLNRRVCAPVSAVTLVTGKVAGQQVNLSILVSR